MLDTNTWKQLPFSHSNDVTVFQLEHPQGKVMIFNIYNDCKHLDTVHHLKQYVEAERHSIIQQDLDTMLWCRDFNHHHPMWDEERNHHLFTATATAEAEKLILALADYNIVMTLLKHLPTLQLMMTKNWTRVDNVFCMDNVIDSVITCDTDPGTSGPGTDHVPIHTMLKVEVALNPPISSHNFRMVDWENLRVQLGEWLEHLPDTKELKTIEDFNTAVDALTPIIQDTIEVTVPLSKPVPHSRRWWSKELPDLKRKKNKLNNQSYIY